MVIEIIAYGLDVHQATTSAAVLDSSGKLVMESILETKSEVLLQFLAGLREACKSPSKREPRQHGRTIFSTPTWLAWWFVIRARTPC